MLLKFALSFFSTFAWGLNCKNEAGLDVSRSRTQLQFQEAVPTWTIMKLPKGTSYYYYDSDNGYVFSNTSLNDTTHGALTHTVSQLWNTSINYMIYNDEPPYQTTYNFSVAHSKAIWMWDTENAIVITHSIPKYPQGPKLQPTYTGLLSNAWDYGQSASCFELSLKSLPYVFNLIYQTVPLIYDNYCITNTSVACNDWPLQVQPALHNCSVHIIDNTYTMFMKPSISKIDIWSECISPYFSSNISVESWIHGKMDNAYCPPKYKYETLDIQSLKFPGGQTFTEYDDHSKWGILQNQIVCFGDLNRVTSQMTRAGTVYCWKDVQLWTQLNALVVSTNICKS
jgi:hypothetical protein